MMLEFRYLYTWAAKPCSGLLQETSRTLLLWRCQAWKPWATLKNWRAPTCVVKLTKPNPRHESLEMSTGRCTKSYVPAQPTESNNSTSMSRVKKLGRFRNITVDRPSSFGFVRLSTCCSSLQSEAPAVAGLVVEDLPVPQDPGGRIGDAVAGAAGYAGVAGSFLMKQPGGAATDGAAEQAGEACSFLMKHP